MSITAVAMAYVFGKIFVVVLKAMVEPIVLNQVVRRFLTAIIKEYGTFTCVSSSEVFLRSFFEI